MNDAVWIKIIFVLILLFIIVVVVRMVFDIRVRVASLEVMMRQRPTTKEVHSMVQQAGDMVDAPNPEELEADLQDMVLPSDDQENQKKNK